MTAHSAAPGVHVHANPSARQAEILTDEALAFLADLHRRFNARRLELLARRMERQKLFDAGQLPHFLTETKAVRDGDWKVAPIPADLLDRRVEITGPVDRKMIVNALNSGAKVFMADFEDASSPMWANMIEGQANLKDRWAGTLDFTDPSTGKDYSIKSNPAALMVRPRGWHLPERHVTVDGREISGGAVRLRPLCLSLRQDADGPGRRRPPSICRRWKAISRRASGTRFSRTRNRRSAFRTARSRRPC